MHVLEQKGAKTRSLPGARACLHFDVHFNVGTHALRVRRMPLVETAGAASPGTPTRAKRKSSVGEGATQSAGAGGTARCPARSLTRTCRAL